MSRSLTVRGKQGVEHEMQESFFLTTSEDDEPNKVISNKDDIDAKAEEISEVP